MGCVAYQLVPNYGMASEVVANRPRQDEKAPENKFVKRLMSNRMLLGSNNTLSSKAMGLQ